MGGYHWSFVLGTVPRGTEAIAKADAPVDNDEEMRNEK